MNTEVFVGKKTHRKWKETKGVSRNEDSEFSVKEFLLMDVLWLNVMMVSITNSRHMYFWQCGLRLFLSWEDAAIDSKRNSAVLTAVQQNEEYQ